MLLNCSKRLGYHVRDTLELNSVTICLQVLYVVTCTCTCNARCVMTNVIVLVDECCIWW